MQLAQHAVELSTGMAPQDYKPMMQNRADGTQSPQPAHQNMPFQHEQQMMGGDMNHGNVDHNQSDFGTPNDGQAPRKRSKVSRACDECRRKKIRCDATSEGPNASCTSCKRMATVCQFSRVPMKRGPSKGYIKELADRLNHLEGAIQNSHGGEPIQYPQPNADLSRRQSQDFSPPPTLDGTPSIGRKRGYSSVAQEFGTPGYAQQTPQRQSGQWSQMDMPRHTPQQFTHAAPEPYRAIFSPNGLAPQAQFPVGRPANMSLDGNFNLDGLNLNDRLDIDDAVVEEYFRTIHATFPVLPWKDNFYERMSKCPAPVANAVLLSIIAAVNSFNGNYNSNDQRKANNYIVLCMSDEFGLSKQFPDSRLMLLSALALMAIDAGQRSNNAVSQASYLGQALAVAKDLRLYSYQEGTRPEENSDDYLGRRLWVSLYILDRCYSAGWSTPPFIPDTSFVLFKDDEETLSSQVYEGARISATYGHYANFLTSRPSNPDTSSFLASVVSTRLNDLRLDFSALPNHSSETLPFTYLFFWHARLLLSRISPLPPTEILTLSRQIIDVTPSTLSPLCRDFVVLAVVSVMELLESEVPGVKEQAEQILQLWLSIQPRLISPGSWDVGLRELVIKRGGANNSPSQTHAAPQAPMGQAQAQNQAQNQGGSAAALTASQGLQHLADLATAGDAGREQDLKSELTAAVAGGQAVAWDKEKLTKYGFLTILSDDRQKVMRN